MAGLLGEWDFWPRQSMYGRANAPGGGELKPKIVDSVGIAEKDILNKLDSCLAAQIAFSDKVTDHLMNNVSVQYNIRWE